MLMTRLAALAAAAILACAPIAAAAQVDIRTAPLAAPLTGTERTGAVQGAGCSTKTAPCASVAITPDLLRTFIAAAFQPKDPDLDAIAALTTQPFGRSLLTQADAAAVRGALGLGTISTQAASGVAITGGSVTGITDLTVADGGTGASTAAAARGNLGAAAAGANGDITSITGLTTPLSAAQGGTGDAGGAWTAVTPTFTCGSGTLTSGTASARYKRIGRTVMYQFRLAISTNGSCASYIEITLPFAAVGSGVQYFLFGKETQVTGNLLAANINGTVAYVTRADGTYPGANGYTVQVSGAYEAAN